MKEVYAFNERTQKDPENKRVNTARGIDYGLYNLLASLGSTIHAEMPEVLARPQKRQAIVAVA